MNPAFILGIVLGLFCISTAMADDDAPVSPKIRKIDGQTAVILDEKTQQLSGIATTVLKVASVKQEILAYGKAISIQPLLALRQRYLAALTERNRATAKFKLAEQSVRRQQNLYQDGVTAKRNLQDQETQWQTDKSLLDAAYFQDQAIVDETVLNWGKTLADWALTPRTEKLADFLLGKQSLLQITVPSHHRPADILHTIAVDVSGQRNKAQSAEFIGIAPQTDGITQGISYFFRTSGKTIKTGMSVSAWLPEQNQQQNGVIIPATAVCWAEDRAYVYLKIADDTFSRRAIIHYTTAQEGYFVNDTLKPGDVIVTTGAQMLLSEELHGQIPDEDKD